MAHGWGALDVALNLSGPSCAALIYPGQWARILSSVMDGVSESDYYVFREVIDSYLVYMGSTSVGL